MNHKWSNPCHKCILRQQKLQNHTQTHTTELSTKKKTQKITLWVWKTTWKFKNVEHCCAIRIPCCQCTSSSIATYPRYGEPYTDPPSVRKSRRPAHCLFHGFLYLVPFNGKAWKENTVLVNHLHKDHQRWQKPSWIFWHLGRTEDIENKKRNQRVNLDSVWAFCDF